MADIAPEAPRTRRIRWVAASSAVMLGTIAVRIATSSAPDHPAAIAVFAAAGSFATVFVLLSAKPRLVGFAASAALGVARSVRMVIAGLVFFVAILPIVLYLLHDPLPALLLPTVAILEAANAAGGPGGELLALVFVLQFLMARDARRLARDATRDELAAGERLGWALGCAPVLVALVAGLFAAGTRTAALDCPAARLTVCRGHRPDAGARTMRVATRRTGGARVHAMPRAEHSSALRTHPLIVTYQPVATDFLRLRGVPRLGSPRRLFRDIALPKHDRLE